MVNAVDLSFVLDASTVDILSKNGVTHVGRYLSHTSWKGLNAKEVAAIKAAGLDIISIYETNPTHASYFTAAQGQADAKAAMSLAKEIGQPTGTAIYFTVDFDCPSTTFGAVDEYFLAVKQNLVGYSVGAYGSYSVIGHLKSLGHAEYFFQTLAWSGGKKQSFLHLYQYACDTKLGGLPVDFDSLEQKNVGAWGTPNPVSKPSPTSVPVKRDGKLQVLVTNLNVRNLPSTNGSVLRQVHNGDELEFFYTQDGWYCIASTEDQWIYSANGSYLKEVVVTPEPVKPTPKPVVAPAPAPKPVVKPTPAPAKPVVKPGPPKRTGSVEVVADVLNMRKGPSTNDAVIRQLKKGETYKFYDVQGDWYNLGGDQWAYGGNGAYLKEYTPAPAKPVVKPAPPKPVAPKPEYHTVVSGDTLSGIAAKFGTTQAELEKLNGITNPNLIKIGQKLRVK